MSTHSSTLSLSLFTLLHLSHYLLSSSSSVTLPDRFTKSVVPNAPPQKYFELVLPQITDQFTPTCSLLVLQHDFANTIGSPPATAAYSPPPRCPAPWSHVVLEFSAAVKGEQYDRIAGVWLGGVEILRTSTAEPTESGIFWKVRKDVTRYASVLRKSDLALSVMLENVVDDVYTGVYHVNVSLLYYQGRNDQVHDSRVRARVRVSDGVNDGSVSRKIGVLADKTVDVSEIEEEFEVAERDFGGVSVDDDESGGEKLRFRFEDVELRGGTELGEKANAFDEKPADLIMPIASDGDSGFWFRIENETDVHSKEIEIPNNTYKAVLEVYVSFHGRDEFWYSNPPTAYIEKNNLTTNRGNGAFRQIVVTIDELFVGSVEPFPVIFTGGINPLFWEPVVAIGAFDLPTYDIDLTPFLGFLLDGQSHFFRLRVSDSIPFWLVDANLHLWLDSKSSSVMAKSVLYKVPSITFNKNYNFDRLDGKFKISAQRETEFSGWVISSAGNLTTHVSNEFKFKNSIEFERNGQKKEVEQKIKSETVVRVVDELGKLVSQTKLKRKYPLDIEIETLPGPEYNTDLLITKLSHSSYVKTNVRSPNGESWASVSNNQVSRGWMVVRDHSVLIGTGSTNQTLRYDDDTRCYSRSVAAKDGKLLEDTSTPCNQFS
ncbi:hypothetical protein Syun_000198 [Stephania yunnanensis]|uniref:Peptide N-acetyl-beta-D-glucosaminyl asparaginase amidase A N-terminal domain-containing protein n=1 Tax=Stephania yunnanensis TaxID=152371 RepID=A0AAP0LBJ4_9MAGN